jgi:serine/threonine protein kinase
MISEGGYGCIYYPELKTKDKKYISKIQLINFTSDNEYQISKKLQEIKNYNDFFGTVEKSDKININKLDPKLKAACTIIETYDSNKFRIFKMKYIGEYTYLEYLEKASADENLFTYMFETYKRILIGIKLMLSKNIIHHDLKGNNIMFHSLKKIPIIIDFGLSISLDIVEEHLEDYFYTYAPVYYYWSLEVHYINFLIHVNPQPSAEDIKELVISVVDNNKIFQDNLSPDFLDSYKSAATRSLLRFVKKDKKTVIKYLLKFSNTWDNYTLSLLFIKILRFFNMRGFIENDFIIFFAEILLTNIHPYMEERLTPNETYIKFTSFFYNKQISNVQNFQELLENLIETRDIMKNAIRVERGELSRLQQIIP